jgi:hypothetical protein
LGGGELAEDLAQPVVDGFQDSRVLVELRLP